MGERKKLKAEKIKEDRKNLGLAVLRDHPTSPRKMRTLADLVRGMNVLHALHVLQHNPKHSSKSLEKLLRSAIDNWSTKNGNQNSEKLVVKTIMVDSARVLKRIRTAPQGRANRIRKRSNHVTIVVDNE
ncbi:MAG TPA: 50S ribosomal protein L22 [Flavobacteriales bacterium]|nr:50S ribosomal protein L22 [Flavobacteriales bacterium]